MEQRALRVLVLLLVTLVVLRASLLWRTNLGSAIINFAISNTTIGVATKGYCGYVLSLDSGKVLNKICADRPCTGVSYCCSRYVFAFWNGDYFGGAFVYVTDDKGFILNRFSTVASHIPLLTNQGLLICWDCCRLYSLDGRPIRSANVPGYLSTFPKPYQNLIYLPLTVNAVIALYLKKWDFRDVNVILSESPVSVDTCGIYMAIATKNKLYMYSASNPLKPKLLWIRNIKDLGIGSINWISFSPNCHYLAIANEGSKLAIININGVPTSYTYVGIPQTAVLWRKGLLLVGLNNGTILAYGQKRIINPYNAVFSLLKKYLKLKACNITLTKAMGSLYSFIEVRDEIINKLERGFVLLNEANKSLSNDEILKAYLLASVARAEAEASRKMFSLLAELSSDVITKLLSCPPKVLKALILFEQLWQRDQANVLGRINYLEVQASSLMNEALSRGYR